MRLLYLLTHPALKRDALYHGVARNLREEYGHDVVFVYTGPVREFPPGLELRHFESWVKDHHREIDQADLVELENRFPESNLWLAAAAERRLTDYSMLRGAIAWSQYSWEEAVFFLKAAVLFYDSIIEGFQPEFALAQHPDNLHSVLLFELARSRKFRSVMLVRDFYWEDRSFFLQDDQHYRSSRLARLYRETLQDYDKKVLPHEAEVMKAIERRMQEDPAAARRDLVPEVKISDIVKNGLATLVRSRSYFTLTVPDPFDGYWQLSLWKGALSVFLRAKNTLWRKYSKDFKDDVPSQPFVLFPLHYQPEASTIAAAPAFQNMLGVVHALSASLPAGYRLVVKEHPRIGGYRYPEFYRSLRCLPNVVLLRPSVPNQRILGKARAVVTVRGTLGFQAIICGKPTLMLGRKYFDCIDDIVKISDLNELPRVMKRLLASAGDGIRSVPSRAVKAFFLAQRDVLYQRKRSEDESADEKERSYAELLHRMLSDELEFFKAREHESPQPVPAPALKA